MKRLKRLTDQFFIGERAIDFRRIKEGNTAINRCVKKCDHLLLVPNRGIAKAHSHAAETECRNFQTAIAEFSFLHTLLLQVSRVTDTTQPIVVLGIEFSFA